MDPETRANAIRQLLWGAASVVAIGTGLAIPVLATFDALSVPAESGSSQIAGVSVGASAPSFTEGGISAFVMVADNVDSDGDGVLDAVDNCPAWPNPDQLLPPWFVPPGDPDCDGWTTADEGFIGTDPNLACGIAAWPPDFNDDTFINVLDINIMKPAFFSTAPGPPYDVRLDLRPDNNINVLDINRMKPLFFLSCTP